VSVLILYMGMLGLLRGRIFGSIPLSSCVLFCIVEVQIALSCLLDCCGIQIQNSLLPASSRCRVMVVSGLLLPSCLVVGSFRVSVLILFLYYNK